MIVVALGAVGEAPIVEGKGVLGIDLDRLVIVGDGMIVVALGAVRDAPIVEGPRKTLP